MHPRRTRRPRPPLDQAALHELALAYVGRFGTTRAKLTTYLRRKLRERGWAGGAEPDPATLAERFAGSGLIDDSAFAVARAQSLGRRGYGQKRVVAALTAAGVDEPDRAEALSAAQRDAVAAALRFAERRRLGPFAAQPPADRRERERQIAAMVRAGHPIALVLEILRFPPGADPDPEQLAANFSHTGE